MVMAQTCGHSSLSWSQAGTPGRDSFHRMGRSCQTRQEAGKVEEGKWLFLSRIPHSLAKLNFSSPLATLFFPLSLFHGYVVSPAFTLSTKGLSLLHSPVGALCPLPQWIPMEVLQSDCSN